jgi:hypothetical protein
MLAEIVLAEILGEIEDWPAVRCVCSQLLKLAGIAWGCLGISLWFRRAERGWRAMCRAPSKSQKKKEKHRRRKERDAVEESDGTQTRGPQAIPPDACERTEPTADSAAPQPTILELAPELLAIHAVEPQHRRRPGSGSATLILTANRASWPGWNGRVQNGAITPWR